ncbi:curlin [Pelagibacterium luteolum]|uniref:Minor curlin subunit n=1 Tax=Pelagibacterium luteolum TaxID=440168 RepID=A0A1G7TS36_9HYPH|nr:curlin [Pelagibacterium luteolum]SDG37774.1 minor curlin subunit [Pelagibacterium luteolum]
MAKISAIAVAAVMTLSVISFTAPAAHAGQVSINLAPTNAEQHRMMQLGLGVYGLVKNIESGSITQHGNNNRAGLSQGGSRNLGIVHQEGNRHTGTLEQQGGGNSYGLFQFGRGTQANVRQNGGQSGLGFVFGW